MSNNFDDTETMFDANEIIETMIHDRVEARTSRFIANFCMSVMLILLGFVGFGGTYLLLYTSQEKTIIIKQPN
jgi:hypothetical protein